MNKRLRLPLALSLALGSSTACALGLGQIEVKSGLNQPLSAEIPVVSNQAGETDALTVRLAPPEALARVGLPAPTGMAANLEFVVETRDSGEKVIKVTTPGKINDPFVTFLLEVDWGKGRMLREYTVLLDPPTMAPVRSAPVATAPVAETPATTEALPEVPPPPPMTETEAPPVAEAQVEPEPTAETPAPTPEAVPPAPEPEPARERVDTYGPVASGETLWSIAQYARPDESVSMNQMMLALLYANPDAFIDQNINRLKKGAILRIPGREEAMATAVADAAVQVREQMQNWRQAAPPVSQPAEPEPDATTSPRTTTAPTPTDSRLELVPPRAGETGSGAQSGASVAGEGAELRAELARSREETASITRENVELKSRVGELEKIQSDSQRLIELKDSELKAAQEQLAALQAREAAEAAAVADGRPGDATSTPTDAAPAETPADGTTPPEAVDASTAGTETPTDTAAPTDTAPTDAAAPTDTAAPTVSSTDTTPSPEAAVPATTTEALPPLPEPTPWYTNLWILVGAGLVLVGSIAFALSRRRKAVVTTAPRYGSGELASSVAAAQATAAAREPKVKVAPPAREPAPDRAAVLAEAVARDPGNLNRHLELVRHQYQSGDAAGFEQAAEAMYARVYDPENLAWKQVVAMGHEIAPEHPLFLQEAAPAPVAVAVPVAVVAPVASAPAAPAPREVDWSRPAPSDSGTTQQMRIDDVRQARPAPAPVPEPEPTFEPMLDFEPATDFDNDTQSTYAEPAPASSDGGFIDADAASTKLELARAYLDMGDVEGARGMLEEVVTEGNPGQRAEAKRLLDEIR